MWGLIFMVLVAGGIYSCSESDWYKAEVARLAAKEAAERTPRIVSSSADGCAVYAFNPDGRWRYFTRCGTQTTTDNTYTQRSGKTSTQVPDSITTENTR